MLIQSPLRPPSVPMPQWNISIISPAETPVSEQALRVVQGYQGVGLELVRLSKTKLSKISIYRKGYLHMCWHRWSVCERRSES